MRGTEVMADDLTELLARPIDTLNFQGRRPMMAMRKLGIKTIGALVNCTAEDLLENKNFGQVSLAEVRFQLAKHGLALRGEGSDRLAEENDEVF